MSSDLSVLEHVDTSTITQTGNSDGDHDLFAHYVSKADLELATFTGMPATALCGKKWLPTKDPSRFGVCPTCKSIYENMQPGDPDSPDYQGDNPTPMEPPC